MNIIKHMFIAVFTFIIFANAQFYNENKSKDIGPNFEYNISKQFNDDLKSIKLLLLVELKYDDLTFVKSDSSGYDAELEWLFAIYSDEKLLFSRTITKSKNVKIYEQTNSKNESIILNSNVLLDPGNYQLLLRTVDLNTNKTAQKRVDISIPNYYEDKTAVSDILLLDSVEYDSAGEIKQFNPILENNFSVKKGAFYIFFNVFTKELNKEISINYKFTGSGNKVDFDTTYVQQSTEHFVSYILKIKKNIFKENKYNITVTATIGDEQKSSQRNITFYWDFVPTNVKDIKLAISQMIYILSSDSLDYYINQDLKTQQIFFKRFWQMRDPNPSTAENELMDEYYTRINYANNNYGSFGLDGWNTDRGRIFIKFGDPDEIDRHPFEIDTKPYIVWRYYSLRKEFVFQDYTGFGDYRLHPNFLNVEFE